MAATAARAHYQPDDVVTGQGRTPSPLWLRAVATGSFLVALANAWGWTWHRHQLDFAVYLMGAGHLTSNLLYTAGLPYAPHLPFTYPPFSAMFFWPFTLVSLSAAALLWATINLAALAAVLAVVLRTIRPVEVAGVLRTPWTWVLLLLGPAVLLEPVMLSFSFGQINLFLCALVLSDATGRLTIGGRTLPRGILLGVAAAIKLIPLIFVPYFVMTRQFRAAWTALATFVVCSAVPFALNPGASWSFWTFYISDVKRVGGVQYISNQSLRGSLDRLAHHDFNGLGITALEGLVALAGLAVAYVAWRRSSTMLAVLVTADAGLLASPITWCHHMVYVVPILAWLIWGSDRPRLGRFLAAVVAGLFYWAPMWHIPNSGSLDLDEHGWHLLAGSAFFFCAVAFLVTIATLLWRRPKAAL